jgi:glyoxylase-like metal-dependent hydrolase (beta-lactamase superfamily II)
VAVRLHSVEGNSQRLDGGAMFGNCPRAVWERWIAPDAAGMIPLACRALLVRDGARAILLEAGIGVFFEPALRARYGVVEPRHVLLDNLAAVGVPHDRVDVVVLSHLHFDHAGGLLAPWAEGAPLRLLFPHARLLVGEAAWERARRPHARDRASFIPELPELLEASGRLEIVPDGATASDTLGSSFRLHRSDGHTPGLIMTEVATPEGPVLYAADLIPGLPWMHLPITMGYDRNPELLVDEKRARLESLLERNGAVFFTHDPTVPVARVTRDARGRFGGDPLPL